LVEGGGAAAQEGDALADGTMPAVLHELLLDSLNESAVVRADVKVFKVVKTPAKAIDRDPRRFVGVEAGSTRITTSKDLRYTVKPGDMLRIDGSNVVTLSNSPEAPF
jgi:hypothetical protein